MAQALAFAGFLALIGGAIYLMWRTPSRHDIGRSNSDAGNGGGGGGSWHHGAGSDSGTGGDSGGGGDGGGSSH